MPLPTGSSVSLLCPACPLQWARAVIPQCPKCACYWTTERPLGKRTGHQPCFNLKPLVRRGARSPQAVSSPGSRPHGPPSHSRRCPWWPCMTAVRQTDFTLGVPLPQDNPSPDSFVAKQLSKEGPEPMRNHGWGCLTSSQKHVGGASSEFGRGQVTRKPPVVARHPGKHSHSLHSHRGCHKVAPHCHFLLFTSRARSLHPAFAVSVESGFAPARSVQTCPGQALATHSGTTGQTHS